MIMLSNIAVFLAKANMTEVTILHIAEKVIEVMVSGYCSYQPTR
jgi:hypothetical protein